jgi:predicted TIM-barrel fold metal-dependent hydrolase
LKDRVPRMMRGLDGGDGWSYDGGPPKRTLGIEATAGRETADKRMSGLRFEEILPGNYDGAAHAKDMEQDGVDVSVVYPNSAISAYTIEDRELALACLRSYNDWVLAEFQGASPAHIVGLPMLPVDDGMDICLAELERVVAAGARGLFIPGSPARPYHDAYYDPLFAFAAEAGLPLTFHRNFGGKPSEADWDGFSEQVLTTAGTVYRFFSAVRPFTYMLFGGVFVRHPGLKVVCAEVNFGWLPFWAQTMEQNFEVRSNLHDASIQADRRPTEYLGRNLFVTVLDDHVGFGMVKEYPWLADTALYSTDYPHSVTLWPRSRQVIATLTSGLPADASEKILSANAALLYRV